MDVILHYSRSQETHKTHPVGRSNWENDSHRLSRRNTTETSAGFEEVVIDYLRFGEGGETEVAFEASEGSCSGFEVRPFSFQAVVVRELKERLVNEVFVGFDAEVAESAYITPETVGEDFSGLHMRRSGIGHGEGVSRALRIAPRGEVMPEVGVVSRDVVEPEPSFVPAAFELSFVCEDSWFSPSLFRGESKFAALIGEEEGGFVGPTRDRVVGDFDAVQVNEDSDDRRRRQGAEEGEVDSDSDSGGGEIHFVPVEEGLKFSLYKANLFWVSDSMDRVSARERDIDFVRAPALALGVMPVAAEAERVGEVFEDAHTGTALRADDFWVFSDSGRTTWDELVTAVRIFAAVSLRIGFGFEPEAVGIAAAARARRIESFVTHKNLLSGCKVEEHYESHNPISEGRLQVNNFLLIR